MVGRAHQRQQESCNSLDTKQQGPSTVRALAVRHKPLGAPVLLGHHYIISAHVRQQSRLGGLPRAARTCPSVNTPSHSI